MTYYDFSSGFNLLNQGINSLGQALGNQYDTQGYQQIAQALSGANPDYAKAMSLAAAYGKPDLMLHFSDAAQRQQFGAQFQREYGAGGGGTGTAPFCAVSMICGPSAPRCRKTEAAPGPPLNTKLTARSCPAVASVR